MLGIYFFGLFYCVMSMKFVILCILANATYPWYGFDHENDEPGCNGASLCELV